MKKKLFLSVLTGMTLALPSVFFNKAEAFTISDEGKYALVMNLKPSDYGADIDGLDGKILRFNFDQGEERVKLSDLTKGIVPFNGKNEFSGWTLSWNDNEPVSGDTSFTPDDFTSSGYQDSGSYEKGKNVYALFTGRELKGTGTYYLTFDPFAGKVDGKNTLRLTSKTEDFKTIDLSKYSAQREGCKFCGWDYNGTIVTSIDKSYFSKSDAITLTALYKSVVAFDETKDGRYALILDANGGTIDGEKSKKYDYLGGKDSGTSMAIFHYIPERKGYKFKGWNSKKDGSGKDYKYMYWRSWRNEESTSEFDKDSLSEDKIIYNNLTLYANWEKQADSTETEQPVKKIESISDIKGNIQFENSSQLKSNYKLDIKEVEVKEDLINKNVKFIADINVLDDASRIVSINGEKMKIRIALPEGLKGYNKYEIVYIKDGEIKETLPATIEDGYIVFETSHLSQYGIVATNVVENNETTQLQEQQSQKQKSQNSKTQTTNTNKKTATINPKTGDNIAASIVLFAVSSIGIIALPAARKKFNR